MLDSIIGPVEIEYILDLLLAMALSFAIGAERESRGKDAGISTHTLVIVGAMLFTFMSMTVDPASKSRIAAQIVSGIGFLGAGLIIKEGASVKNLTTAASIYVRTKRNSIRSGSSHLCDCFSQLLRFDIAIAVYGAQSALGHSQLITKRGDLSHGDSDCYGECDQPRKCAYPSGRICVAQQCAVRQAFKAQPVEADFV